MRFWLPRTVQQFPQVPRITFGTLLASFEPSWTLFVEASRWCATCSTRSRILHHDSSNGTKGRAEARPHPAEESRGWSRGILDGVWASVIPTNRIHGSWNERVGSVISAAGSLGFSIPGSVSVSKGTEDGIEPGTIPLS
eukprot:scaffold1401_cov330-Pavlova_lutheri.AAC.92